MEKMKQRFLALVRFWQRRRISLALFVALVVAVVFLGLHDVGMILAYLATAIIIVELTPRWRKIRNFIILFFASFLGSILLAFLHVEVVSPLVRLLLGAAAIESLGFRIYNDTVSLAMI